MLYNRIRIRSPGFRLWMGRVFDPFFSWFTHSYRRLAELKINRWTYFFDAKLRIRVFGQISDPGLCTLTEGRFLNFGWINILDNFKSLLFCFHTVGVGCSFDVLDPKKQPGSGSGFRALRITEDVWHPKYENKKEGFWNYRKHSSKRI